MRDNSMLIVPALVALYDALTTIVNNVYFIMRVYHHNRIDTETGSWERHPNQLYLRHASKYLYK
jgi:hypothetical protein